MSEDVVDHQARADAASALAEAKAALAAIAHTQKTLDDHMRRGENFEVEMRTGISNIMQTIISGHDKISKDIAATVGRVHGRMDAWVKTGFLAAVATLVALIVYIWKVQVGG